MSIYVYVESKENPEQRETLSIFVLLVSMSDVVIFHHVPFPIQHDTHKESLEMNFPLSHS